MSLYRLSQKPESMLVHCITITVAGNHIAQIAQKCECRCDSVTSSVSCKEERLESHS